MGCHIKGVDQAMRILFDSTKHGIRAGVIDTPDPDDTTKEETVCAAQREHRRVFMCTVTSRDELPVQEAPRTVGKAKQASILARTRWL